MRRAEVLEGVRMMRFRDVFGRCERQELSRLEAAELLGVSERTMRRWCRRFEAEGEGGLAQIERHWEFNVRDLGAADLVASIHLELKADGSVGRADIVDDPRYSSDPHYRNRAQILR